MNTKMVAVDSDILESIWSKMSDCRTYLWADNYFLARRDFRRAMQELETLMVSTMEYEQAYFDKRWEEYQPRK